MVLEAGNVLSDQRLQRCLTTTARAADRRRDHFTMHFVAIVGEAAERTDNWRFEGVGNEIRAERKSRLVAKKWQGNRAIAGAMTISQENPPRLRRSAPP